jgi:hypothetical protein
MRVREFGGVSASMGGCALVRCCNIDEREGLYYLSFDANKGNFTICENKTPSCAGTTVVVEAAASLVVSWGY